MAQIKLQSEDNQIATISFESGAGSDREIIIPKEGGILGTKADLFDRSRKNYIINGNFDIWQRGTSQTTSGYGSCDRWKNLNVGSTKSIERIAFALGQTFVPGNPKYFMRTTVASVVGVSNYVRSEQCIENVMNFAGQKVTLSFWAKADANKNIAIAFYQHFGIGGSAVEYGIGAQLVPLTADWQKKTITVDIPSIVGKTLGTEGTDHLGIIFWFDAGANFGATANLGQQSGTFDIAQVQLEAGETTTEFEYRTVGEELALCQRYCLVENTPRALRISGSSYVAGALLTTVIYFPVTMRAVPVITVYNVSGGGFDLASLTTTKEGYNSFFASATSTAVAPSIFLNANYTADAEL